MTSIEGLFNLICQEEEPMVMLAMMALDEGKYSGVGIDALEGHMLAFIGDTVNGQLPLVFSLTTGTSRMLADQTLGLVRGASVPSLMPLAAHYVTQGNTYCLVTAAVGGAAATVQDLPQCLLIPIAWALYFCGLMPFIQQWH
eukprot:4564008-Ditylum_brightwellii.AAC.1